MSPPRSPAHGRRHRHRLFIITGLVLLVAAFVAIEVVIQRSPATPAPVSNTVLLHAITILNITLTLVLLFVLGRNLIKLYIDRRRQTLGSKFGTKLVMTYIGLALVPSVLLFLVASDLIQKSVDRWFSTAAAEVASRSRELARKALVAEETRLLGAARSIADQITEGRLLSRDAWQLLRKQVDSRRRMLGLDAVAVYQGSQLFIDPVVDSEGALAGEAPELLVPDAELTLALHGQPFRLQDPVADGSLLVRAGVPIYAPNRRDVVGVLVTARLLPHDLTREAAAIETLYRSYMQGMEQKEPIKLAYLLTFLLITLLVLFSAVWVGLYLARGITVPIRRLAEGTRAVASGNLDFQVEAEARDELATLVASFNQMTRDLRASQVKLEQSRDALQRTNAELEERRRYMEAVLANIATGVISTNAEGQITTFNRAAERMLGIDAAGSLGRHYRDVLAGPALAGLRELLERSQARRAPLEEELSVEAAGQRLTVAAHCSNVRDRAGASLGTVLVLDDLTDLIRAQKAAAWREVARRIAHEIRNPLTPIQLSAQRIARRYRRAAGGEGQYDVIEEGTRTILQEVDTLKGLVSEFSRYARMPAVNPIPSDVHEILEAGLRSCAILHDGIKVEREFARDVPAIEVDADQLKRAFTNIFDNAVEAMEGHGTLRVRTAYDAELEIVRVEIADTGPGIRPEDKERLFLPYFSRKRDGTGLGLAIVHQIISDHSGYVRVTDNHPRGTVFIVELPR